MLTICLLQENGLKFIETEPYVLAPQKLTKTLTAEWVRTDVRKIESNTANTNTDIKLETTTTPRAKKHLPSQGSCNPP